MDHKTATGIGREALRLADEWQCKIHREADRQNSAYDHYGMGNTPETVDPLGAKMAAELRRLHAQVAALTPAQPVSQQHTVDCIGLALDLESCAKKATSQTAQRAMEAAARGLRLLAATAQPAVPQGVAYAELPWTAITTPFPHCFTADDMRDFADRTHALRAEALAAAYREELDKLSQRNYELRFASHGQAPAQPDQLPRS